MSATEVLRRLLDERGVEYETYIEQPTGFEHVKWNFNEHGSADFNLEFGEPWLTMYGVISGPEQAIDATLGRGTCKPREVRSRFSKTQEYVTYHCECGHELGGYMTAELPFPHTYNEDELPNYCPNCGRRVEQ